MDLSEIFPEASELIQSIPSPDCLTSVVIRVPQKRIDVRYSLGDNTHVEINIFPEWCSWDARFGSGIDNYFEGSFQIKPIDQNGKFMLVECLQRLVELERAGK